MTMHKRILVADASETIIAVCRKLLTQHGYDVNLFQDGTKALEELKRTDYDLAVIATTTQNVSGYFIVQELRKDRSKAQMPVLMLLGSSELLDTKELVQVAPSETLSKPFSPQELMFKIDRLMDRGDSMSSGEVGGDEGIESLLNADDDSFEKKISSATDKIFLNMLKQSAGDPPPAERPTIDKLDLTEDQYDVEAASPERKPEDTPHDYDWFIREMTGEEAKKSEAKPHIPQAGKSGKFQVEEIGTSKMSTSQLKKIQQMAEDTKTKVYIEKLNEPLETEKDLDQPLQSDTGKLDQRSLFIKFFAESLARELAKSIDFDLLLARLQDSETRKTKK